MLPNRKKRHDYFLPVQLLFLKVTFTYFKNILSQWANHHALFKYYFFKFLKSFYQCYILSFTARIAYYILSAVYNIGYMWLVVHWGHSWFRNKMKVWHAGKLDVHRTFLRRHFWFGSSYRLINSNHAFLPNIISWYIRNGVDMINSFFNNGQPGRVEGKFSKLAVAISSLQLFWPEHCIDELHREIADRRGLARQRVQLIGGEVIDIG